MEPGAPGAPGYPAGPGGDWERQTFESMGTRAPTYALMLGKGGLAHATPPARPTAAAVIAAAGPSGGWMQSAGGAGAIPSFNSLESVFALPTPAGTRSGTPATNPSPPAGAMLAGRGGMLDPLESCRKGPGGGLVVGPRRRKNVRATTKALQRALWELEVAARRGEKHEPRPHSRGITLHVVLEEVTKRIRKLKSQRQSAPHQGKACGKAACGKADAGAPGPVGGALAPEAVKAHGPSCLGARDVVAGMEGSSSIGVLYVCVEDWVVRRSNRAMELVCPHPLLRGYAGFELTPFVHPDDHVQLRLLKEEQVHAFQPGDTALVLSVRMLRACQDGETMVCGWRRQILEVAHVARDKEHGGKLHVLFTCVLEPDSIEPLTFDDWDRELFREAAAAVSGVLVPDAQRTTKSYDKVTKMMGEMGLKEKPEDLPATEPDLPAAEPSFWSGMASSAVQYLKSCAASTFNNLVRMNVILGLDREGVPWIQKAGSISAFGFSSGWRIYNNHKMSGTPSSYVKTEKVFYGATKPRRLAGRGAAIGFMGFVLKTPEEAGGPPKGRFGFMTENQFLCDFERKTAREKSFMLFPKHVGELPPKIELNSTRISPPDPQLAENFWTFSEPQRLVDPLKWMREGD